jgi:hypothetical protein
MKAVVITLFLMVLIPSLHALDEASSPPIGNWEGESICTVANSPCHDEHVVYEIKPDETDHGKLDVSAYKIVNGEKQFMGTLNCRWKGHENVLSCHYREDDDWTFKLTGNEMKGELHIKKERQLYRKISVTKK